MPEKSVDGAGAVKGEEEGDADAVFCAGGAENGVEPPAGGVKGKGIDGPDFPFLKALTPKGTAMPTPAARTTAALRSDSSSRSDLEACGV